MKIVIFNFSGNTGKTTLAKHLFVPQIPGAQRITIEDLNVGDGQADVEIAAGKFRELAAQLNVADDDEHFVIDLGASAAKEMLVHFSTLRSTRRAIDFWVIPVTPAAKQVADTLNTIAALADLGISPASMVVVLNNVVDVAAFESDFALIASASEKFGFSVAHQAVLSSEIFDTLKGRQETVFDIADDRADFKALRRELKGDLAALEQLGRRMVIRDLAEAAVDNLRAVFASTPIATAIEAVDTH